jgi:MFS transporter, DHA2 family, multidrug resistance protein
MNLSERVAARAHERRWLILGVLCVSLLVIVIDNSILNVAIPTIINDLGASTSQVQWIVDAYTLVFAGLLLTAGSLSDRFGRRRVLQIGFAIFGVGSLACALADSAGQLIAFRAFMGVGGACIMPSTLSIITNLFPANERGRAIGFWAATAGIAAGLGPLTGGVLLEHFYFGSIFLVNLPIVAGGIVAGVFLIPESRDPGARRLDPIGAVLSVASLSTLLYAVIEAPDKGWTAGGTLALFGIGGVLLAAFFTWEVRNPTPMLDLSFFRNPRFATPSAAISMTFFGMFGSLFLLTQYLQFVHGYTPLETGIRVLAFAIPVGVVAPLSPRLVDKVGAKVVVATGLALFAVGLIVAGGLEVSSSYPAVAWRLVVMAIGVGLVTAPATTSIMGSLPLARAGVGSAVNDTTRQIGGAVGVAVVGSVFASIYGSQIVDAFAARGIHGEPLEAAKRSLGAALGVARRLGPDIAAAAQKAFVDGMHAGFYVGATLILITAVAVAIWLPAHARREDVERQDAEWKRQRVAEPTA